MSHGRKAMVSESIKALMLTPSLGTHEHCTSRCMLRDAWLAEAILRSVTTDRNRTALRKGMVCHHGDMSCNDHFSRGGGWVVFGDVCLPTDREGMGLDWRRTG